MESLNWKAEKKNKLYFNSYTYKARVKIVGACYTYYTSDIDTFLQRISKWKEESKNSLVYKIGDLRKNYWDNINSDVVEKFLIWRDLHSQKDCIIRIQGDYVSVFANNLDIFKSLTYISNDITYYKVELTTQGSIELKKKKQYNYRTYFKGKRIPKDFIENFNTFNSIYKSNVDHISPAMIKYLQRQWSPYMYMHGSYFIDYVDESFKTILHMYFPDMLAKTYKLEEQHKN